MISPDKIEKIREIPLHHFLGIVNNGRRTPIKCPFHSAGNERTPSFMLYPDDSYFCFGCGAFGSNCIDFILDLGGTFNEAIEELSKYV